MVKVLMMMVGLVHLGVLLLISLVFLYASHGRLLAARIVPQRLILLLLSLRALVVAVASVVDPV